MKNNFKDFLEQAGLSAMAIVLVFSLHSKFAKKPNASFPEPIEKTERVKTDSIQCKTSAFAIQQKSKIH